MTTSTPDKLNKKYWFGLGEFIAVMLRDVADAFENPAPEDESSCDCC